MQSPHRTIARSGTAPARGISASTVREAAEADVVSDGDAIVAAFRVAFGDRVKGAHLLTDPVETPPITLLRVTMTADAFADVGALVDGETQALERLGRTRPDLVGRFAVEYAAAD